MKSNQIIVITGQSCAGKTTLMRTLVEAGVGRRVVSHTTRPQREHEIDGVDYHFVTPEKFDRMLGQQEILESNQYGGHLYGISKGAMKGDSLIAVVELNGLRALRAYASTQLRTNLLHVRVSASAEKRAARFLSRVGAGMRHEAAVARLAEMLNEKDEPSEWGRHLWVSGEATPALHVSAINHRMLCDPE